MTIVAPYGASRFIQALVQSIQQEIDAKTVTLLGGKAFSISDLPDASKHRYKIIPLSDGASNMPLAVSDGTDWRYPDGTTV